MPTESDDDAAEIDGPNRDECKKCNDRERQCAALGYNSEGVGLKLFP